ncbi:MAG: hypothetical protein OEV49_11300 [candidate division Zixibacteria bacterium]|nr:hypothetical protein [candidate division Zixibacteria bacterium]MDH3937517.1 hypothetical protein [candidate division Zixibacteria bacterium]MDH4034133.1 hypothetical protein [candidate division Zixibacteria bacterium]
MTKTSLFVSALLLLPVTAISQDMCAVSLDHVTGANGGQIPISNQEVTFSIRITNLSQTSGVKGLTNGFELSGSDPAVNWNVTDTGALQFVRDIFDLVFGYSMVNVDGFGADTIGIGGSIMLGAPLPRGYSDTAYWFSIVVNDPAAVGHQLCLDSCYYPPNGTWMWAYGSSVGSFAPLWDGPHCFEIASCCQGMRGNIDCDPSGEITISDLIYLVTYMFSDGPAPIDMATADFGDDGSADITDLIYIVEYMFRDGPAPPACPE